MANNKSARHKPHPSVAAFAAALSTPLPLFAQVAPAEPPPVLPTVEVQDTYGREQQTYQGTTTRVGKLDQLPKDVPQALTIVSEKLMFEKNANTLKEALGNVSGLTYNAGEGGRIGDNMNLRGFYSFGDLYMDGIRDVAQYNRDTYNLEQIDVLRGSGSMLFGRGQAGGVINQVSKTPRQYDLDTVSATVGSHDYKRVTADLNKEIGEDMAVRLNAMKTDAGSSRDHVSSEREGVAPSIRWGIGSADEFLLGHYYLKTHNTPDYGVPFFERRPLDVPASRFYGTTSDYEDNTTNISTASWTHRFSADTELRTVLRYAEYERDLWVNQPQLRTSRDPVTGRCSGTPTTVSADSLICRSTKARGGEERTVTSQTDFSTKFDTGLLKHQALLGAELLKEDAARWSYSTDPGVLGGTMPATTVGDPDASPGDLPPGYGHRDKSNINSYVGNSMGLYAQDTVEFLPGWKILAGARYDKLDADYDFPASGSVAARSESLEYSEWSYRSGLMYQPTETQSYYLAWNDSFNPTADLYQLDNGAGFPAERSRTWELGAKWELLDGDLSLRTAIYRATKFWERNTDVESSGGILSKKRHTDGFELEAAGRITPNWEVFAGWALMDAKIDVPGYSVDAATGARTPHNPNLEGMRPRNAPPFTWNLWTTYKLGGGWKIGGGVEAKGARLAYGIRPGSDEIEPNVAPGYRRWDAMVAFEQARYTLKLNILNLLDEKYYESVYDNGGHVVPGTERAVQLTAELRF